MINKIIGLVLAVTIGFLPSLSYAGGICGVRGRCNNRIVVDPIIHDFRSIDRFGGLNDFNVVDRVDVLQRNVEFDADYFLGLDGYYDVANQLQEQKYVQDRDLMLQQSGQVDRLIDVLEDLIGRYAEGRRDCPPAAQPTLPVNPGVGAPVQPITQQPITQPAPAPVHPVHPGHLVAPAHPAVPCLPVTAPCKPTADPKQVEAQIQYLQKLLIQIKCQQAVPDIEDIPTQPALPFEPKLPVIELPKYPEPPVEVIPHQPIIQVPVEKLEEKKECKEDLPCTDEDRAILLLLRKLLQKPCPDDEKDVKEDDHKAGDDHVSKPVVVTPPVVVQPQPRPQPVQPAPVQQQPVQPTQPAGPSAAEITKALNNAVHGIFKRDCASCHGSTVQKGGLQLVGEENGQEWLVDLDLEERVLVYDAVAGKNLEEHGIRQMPLGGPALSAQEAEVIRLWALDKSN